MADDARLAAELQQQELRALGLPGAMQSPGVTPAIPPSPSAPRTDLEMAMRMQQEEMAGAAAEVSFWHRVSQRQSRLRFAEAAACLWDPVWGEVEFNEIAYDESYRHRKQRQICGSAMFNCSPCCFVSAAPCCFRGDIKTGGSWSDARRGWRRMVLSWSMALTLPQVVVFLIPMLVDDGLTDVQRYDRWGAKNSARILYRHEWWRLLSPIFLHSSWLHLLGNVAIQLRTGLMLEVMWGHTRWLLIFVVSGAFASLASAIMSPHALSVGSSGALCGIIGAWPPFIVLTWNQTLPRDVPRRNRLMALVICSIALLMAFSFAPMVDWAAHLGGLVMGAVLSLALFADRLQTRSWHWATVITGWVGVVGLLALGYFYFTSFTQPTATLLDL